MKSFAIVPALLLAALVAASHPVTVHATVRAGAARVDVTPAVLPVLVNGGMLGRSVDRVNTPVHARALVLADDRERIAIVVVDSCMMPRPLLDEAKALAWRATGIATNRILVSATHAHSAPSSMGCLGTDADPRYVPWLRDKIVEAIVRAGEHLEPAHIGWAKADAAEYTALRQWIRRPDRLATDPFGNPTVRANMHAGANWDDVTGEAGPEDPDLTLLSIRSAQGRPIAVIGNFSMHYFGDADISADYFGLFAEGLKARLAADAPADAPSFVGMLSHGCSGDIYRVDYKIPEKQRPNPTIRQYTDGLLDLATRALSTVEHRAPSDLAMVERRLPLAYRVPDLQRLEWARRVVSEMGDRPAKTTTEVYAREQILLHEAQRTEVVVQAIRIGDVAIAAVPTETYAVTGLKIKAASPLPNTMVIELANGGDGYIPPPEQHRFGGYNTWPARSAGLEVQAEPKIAEAAVAALERVCEKPRKPWILPAGPATRTTLEAHPYAYWRLDEFGGPVAADATGQGHDAHYEPDVTYYLEGPRPAAFVSGGGANRAPHFVGGRLRARAPGSLPRYSVSMWIWNGMPNDGRDLTGWMFSRGPDFGLAPHGDHLGIGGRSGNAGRLVFLHGDDSNAPIAGTREIPRWEWRHVALVRDGESVRVYLDGKLEIETATSTGFAEGGEPLFFGGRSDGAFNWEGRLDEIALFDRALGAEEVATLAAAETARPPIPEKLVVLTFDDSVASHATVAGPLLKRYGFGATFFVTEGFSFRTNKKDYMTWDQIAGLHRDGFEIGNHTRDHWGVSADTVGRLPGQLEPIAARCREYGIPTPVSFAWPGNAFHTNALPLLRAAGIRFARRGSEPEVPYKEGGGIAYEPGKDHPLLIPSAGDARPTWTLDDFRRAVLRGGNGRIPVIQFHGVPEGEHPWVHTPKERFEEYMAWLHQEGYRAIALRDLERYVDPDRVPADPLAVMNERRGQSAR